VSFVIGSLLLFDPAGEEYQVSIWVALAVAGTMALITGVAVAKIVQARKAPTKTGREELLHETGVVRQRLDPAGAVFVHGEIWSAHTENGPLEAGERVRVDSIGEDFVLEVSRAEEPATVPA
jgi:membrane-bound serine protease (ClpP class)